MKIPMKVLSYQGLVVLNKSSIRAGRMQNLKPEQMPSDTHGQYMVNSHFDHEWKDPWDVRMSVIFKPGVQTVRQKN